MIKFIFTIVMLVSIETKALEFKLHSNYTNNQFVKELNTDILFGIPFTSINTGIRIENLEINHNNLEMGTSDFLINYKFLNKILILGTNVGINLDSRKLFLGLETGLKVYNSEIGLLIEQHPRNEIKRSIFAGFYF